MCKIICLKGTYFSETTYVHTYVHTNVCTYVCTYVHTYVHTNVVLTYQI